VNDKGKFAMFTQRRRLSTGSGMGITTPRNVLRLNVSQVVKITKYCKEGPADTLVKRHYMKCLENRMKKVNKALIAEVESDMKISDQGRQRGETFDSISLTQQKIREKQRERLLSLVRANTSHNSGVVVLRDVAPRSTMIPRRIKTIEQVTEIWRRGDPAEGYDIPLRFLQTAARRKDMIKGYSNSWWTKFGHKDSMARYSQIIKGIVSMLSGSIDMKEEGCDEQWAIALALFHEKWDKNGQAQPITALVPQLRRKE
jgi:hypothetical protein